MRNVADRDAPLLPTPAPGCALGCERKMPLTSTSTLGTVYEARPRTLVRKGSDALQLAWPPITPVAPTAPIVGVIGAPKRAISSAQVSFTPRPVLVPA